MGCALPVEIAQRSSPKHCFAPRIAFTNFMQNLAKLKESRSKKASTPQGPDLMDVDQGETEPAEEEMPQAKRQKVSEEPPAAPSGLPPGFFDQAPAPAPQTEPEVEVDEEAIQAVLHTMTEEDLAETRVVKTRANIFDAAAVERELEEELDDEENGDDESSGEDAVSLPSGFFDAGKRPNPKPKKEQRVKRKTATPNPPKQNSIEYASILDRCRDASFLTNLHPPPPATAATHSLHFPAEFPPSLASRFLLQSLLRHKLKTQTQN